MFSPAVVSEDGTEAYSPTSSGGGGSVGGGGSKQQQQQQQSGHNGGGGLPAFGQRFVTHTSSAYTSPGASRPSYHPITTSGVMPYHLSTVGAVNNAGGSSDPSSLQWASTATVATHGYPNTDGSINYVPIANHPTGRSRSNATFSAAASLHACKYRHVIQLYRHVYDTIFVMYVVT